MGVSASDPQTRAAPSLTAPLNLPLPACPDWISRRAWDLRSCMLRMPNLMAESGLPPAAAGRCNKGEIHQHSAIASFLAADQEETEPRKSGSSLEFVESSSSGNFYLNPLTPKRSCRVSEKFAEVTFEDEKGNLFQSKDDAAGKCSVKAGTSKQGATKLFHLNLQKHDPVPQTSEGISSECVADFLSVSEEIWVESQNFNEGAGERTSDQLKPKCKPFVQKWNWNQQDSNVSDRTMDARSDGVASRLERNKTWLQSDMTSKPKQRKPVLKRQAEDDGGMMGNSDVLPEKAEMVVPKEDNFDKTGSTTNSHDAPEPELYTNPETKCAEADHVTLSKHGKDCIKRKNTRDKTSSKTNKLVTSKLQDLELDRATAANSRPQDNSKISRLLEAMKKRGGMDSDQRPFKCPHCHWAFKKLCYLQSHVATHSGAKPHVCDVCGKAYSHQGTLQQHKRLHTGERPYHCPFCDRSYIWSSDYRKHIRTHTGEKPYECKDCGKDFIRSSDLRKHERNMHTNDKPFPCSHCDKTFNRPLSLQRHERKHLGERPYSCPDCGKRFALASRMAEHQKSHRGVRPFVCSVCGKCFTKSSNLTEHEAIHNGIRPHRCGECGVAFAMASRLVRHQFVHSRARPHTCGVCGRSFSCLPSLQQHQQLNCVGRIFVCVQCDKSFMCADKLTLHVQHQHRAGPKRQEVTSTTTTTTTQG